MKTLEEINRELLEVGNDPNSKPFFEDLEYYRKEILTGRHKKYHEIDDNAGYVDLEADRIERRSKCSEILDRLPPQNLDAEKAILGIYLHYPEKRDGEDSARLQEMFYLDNHEKIHKVIIGLKNLDMILLTEALKKEDCLEAVGGLAYLSELYELGAKLNPEHLSDYIMIVEEKGLRRLFIHLITGVFRFAYEPSEDLEYMVENLSSELENLKRRL